MNLTVKTGNGLKTDNNGQLTIDYDSTYIHQSGNGLYVDDLSAGSGTTYDYWSIYANSESPRQIDINRVKVCLIYTFGLYAATSHSASGIVYSANAKSADDLKNEINEPIRVNGSRNRTSYHPNQGELIQFVTNPATRKVYDSQGVQNNWTVESGNRLSDNNQETKAMFCVTSIEYEANGYSVRSMTLKCIFSAVPDYEVGQAYSTT